MKEKEKYENTLISR